MSNGNPKKWVDVYPQGTEEGNEEQKFFIAVARNPKYKWRTVKAIASETNISPKRIEQIINKYVKKGMIIQSDENEDNWGYWERVADVLEKKKDSIVKTDQNNRIDQNLNPTVVKKASVTKTNP